jgi:ATP-dependent DNA ligase
MKYYNGTRTHLSLEKDAPVSRASIAPDTFFVVQFSAGYTTNMSGFDLRQAQPSGPLWVHEIKHDGYRLMVRRDGSRVRCFTRNGHDWADRFPAKTGQTHAPRGVPVCAV